MNSLRMYWAISPQPTKHRATMKTVIPRRMSRAKMRIMPMMSMGKAVVSSTAPITMRSTSRPEFQPAMAPRIRPRVSRAMVMKVQATRVLRVP